MLFFCFCTCAECKLGLLPLDFEGKVTVYVAVEAFNQLGIFVNGQKLKKVLVLIEENHQFVIEKINQDFDSFVKVYELECVFGNELAIWVENIQNWVFLI